MTITQQIKMLPTTSLQHKVQESSQAFDWEAYLKENGSEAAPVDCFKQALSPLINGFKIGMKLESMDPRSKVMSICLATVVDVRGPRLLLHLNGGDSINDFWCLVDSAEIHAVGRCEKSGNKLQPPHGYRLRASKWADHLCQLLSNALVAPPDVFQTEPPAPPKNLFKIGQKIEAIDAHNPELICCATVNAIKNEQIYVTFDGWGKAYSFWCHYQSRDIFPAGWCARNAHPLQPPVQKLHIADSLSKQPSLSTRFIVMFATDTLAPVAPVLLHFNRNCNGGPFIISYKLPAMLTGETYQMLAKLCLQQVLAATTNTQQLIQKLYGMDADIKILTAAGRYCSVKILLLLRVTNSKSLERFTKILCATCSACPNLITLVPNTKKCMKCMPNRKRQRSQTRTSSVQTNKRMRISDAASSTSSLPSKNAIQNVMTVRRSTRCSLKKSLEHCSS